MSGLIADRTNALRAQQRDRSPSLVPEISIWIDHGARIAHAKAMVIDSPGDLDGLDELDGRCCIQTPKILTLVASPDHSSRLRWVTGNQRLALSSPYNPARRLVS